MQLNDQDEPDGLVQSSFVIPCSSSNRSDSQNTFPVLSKYERNAGPSKLREQGYLRCCKEAKRAFQNTISSVFDPFISEVDRFCQEDRSQTHSFFIPGTSKGDSAKRLSVASLIGPQMSLSLSDRLRDKVQTRKNHHWVTLQARECLSLAATIRLLAARLASGSPSLYHDIASLSSLCSLPSSSTVVIYLQSIALHRYAVLNDLIKALHSAAQWPDFPRLVLLLGSEGGLGSLDDRLDSESIRLMDLQPFTLPSPSLAFDTMTQELFLGSDVDPSVWFGPSTLELLRYQYFDRGFDLDRLLSTVELAYHHHFSTRPLSVFAVLSSSYDSEDWEQDFLDRLRLHLLETNDEGDVSLPRPSNNDSKSKQEYLRDILTDNGCLVASMSDFSSAFKHHRTCIRAAIFLLHTLRRSLFKLTGDESEESLLGPRRTRIGGLAWHVLSDHDVSKLINAVVSAVRQAPMKQLQEGLEEILSSPWATDRVLREAMSSLLSKVQEQVEAEKEPDVEVEMSEMERIDRVRTRVLQSESSDTIKKSIAECYKAILDTWTNSRPVLAQIWIYDFSTYLTQLSDPSSRSSIVSALNDPSSIMTVDESNLPDICRLYQMYQSAGKTINLADLFQAFSHSVQAASSSSSNKRHRKQDAEMEKKEALQARFALAINELGRMGFLKKTRRKPDHVLKLVHDLPSTV